MIVDKKMEVWLSIGSLLYGLSMIFTQTHITIIDPPLRYILIVGMTIVPLVNLLLISLDKKDVLGWSLVLNASLWGMVTVLYFIHPLPNGGWILTGIIVGIYIVALKEGEYNG